MNHRPPRPWTLRAAFAFGLAGLLIACGPPGDDAAQHDVDEDAPAGYTVGPPGADPERDTSLPDAAPEPLAPGGPHAIGDAPERTTPPSRAHAHPDFVDPPPPVFPTPPEDNRPVV